ncbi:hypothetical protein RYX36_030955 [Vicia faba]
MEPSHESVESAKATPFLDDSVDGKFQDKISESVKEEDIEEFSYICRTQPEQPNLYEIQSPLFTEESDSDFKTCSMKSSEECSFVEDYVIDHVLNIGDQRTLNPSSIVKQKHIRVPSSGSSSFSPCAKIPNYVYVTIATIEHGFNYGDFHNDANFTIPLKPPDPAFVLKNFIMPLPLLSKVAFDVTSWGIMLAQLVYMVDWCKHGWNGLSWLDFKDIWSFVRLSIASIVMLCLEVWYMMRFIVLTSHIDNAVIVVNFVSICMHHNEWESMISIGVNATISVRVSNELGL